MPANRFAQAQDMPRKMQVLCRFLNIVTRQDLYENISNIEKEKREKNAKEGKGKNDNTVDERLLRKIILGDDEQPLINAKSRQQFINCVVEYAREKLNIDLGVLSHSSAFLFISSAEQFDEILNGKSKTGANIASRMLMAPPPPTTPSDFVIRNWQLQHNTAPAALLSGVYQIYRRYKPSSEDNLSIDEHPVVCEIIYVDSAARSCILITSELALYFGALYIYHDRGDIISGILQRPSAFGNGLHQRFIYANVSSRRNIYSGIMVKVGDTLHMPIAAECLIVWVPRSEHVELYKEMSDLNNHPWGVYRCNSSSVCADYIIPTPPVGQNDPREKMVKRVRDFPLIKELSLRNPPLFQEPGRALSWATIKGVWRKYAHPLGCNGVFRHSKAE